MLYSAVFVVMNLVTSVTFEEHVRACREDVARDVLKAFPACDLLTDASLLMAETSKPDDTLGCCLLPCGSNFGVEYLRDRSSVRILLHLLLLIATLLIIVYFLIVVRSFGVHIAREYRNYDSHANHIGCHRSSLASQTLPTCYEYFKPSSENREDLPPAYTPFAYF
ncbi:hypothetical protein Anas_10058 [Armadillidium nasatum]|uniref:Uncharacterized protein n=1 Tax=Armadillidium nasatum TaxID=96803 RepID=A0A5N5SMZ7_9CRUS|nr:hypothetical protein Anas_10058 [Armadillidium nasatum]